MDGFLVKTVMADSTEHLFSLSPRLIVAFEQKYGKGMSKLLGEDQHVEHIFWLGWESLKINGLPQKPFGPEFLDTIKSVELVSDPNSASTATA